MDGPDLKRRQTGTRDSGPSDLDLMAQIHLKLDLISRARHQSDGLGKRGGPGAAVARRRPLPRRRFTGGDRSRPSGPQFERHQVLEVEHDALNTPRHLAKQVRARVGVPHGGGGSGRRRNGGAHVSASGAAYGLRQLAQKEQRMLEELTKGL
jgi:hypothetical protein